MGVARGLGRQAFGIGAWLNFDFDWGGRVRRHEYRPEGDLVAAKALAVTGADLFSDAQLVADAKRDFARQMAGKTYKSEIPAGQKPMLDHRFEQDIHTCLSSS